MDRCHWIYGLVFLLSTPLIVSAEQPADQGHGVVSMQGAIIDTPCAIALESRDQSIVMANIPLAQVLREGKGPAQTFSIKLINCTLTPILANRPNWSKFSITFDGPGLGDGLFAVSGQGQGVGLEITDKNGNVALPGQRMLAATLEPTDIIVNFNLRLVKNNQPLRAGSYGAAIRFKLDYY